MTVFRYFPSNHFVSALLTGGQFYGFSVNIPSTTSISSFNVVVNTVGGSTQTFTNNGAGFPVSDAVIAQIPQSCYSNGNLTVVAAVSLPRVQIPSCLLTSYRSEAQSQLLLV